MRFAGARSHPTECNYEIIGVPFDGTSSFRAGSALAPDEIRKASYCFEPYIMEYDFFLPDAGIFDRGDLEEMNSLDQMEKRVKEAVSISIEEKRFPIILGGEHSLTPHAVSEFEDDISVLVLDAHMDYRDEYEGLKGSHATVNRRLSELSINEMMIVGVRSLSHGCAGAQLPEFISADDVSELTGKLLKERFEGQDLYLSLDMDVFDPSLVPGVGNPEPFGIKPVHVKNIISDISYLLVGMDIVETNPRYDPSGVSLNLAARLVYEVIGSREVQ